MSLPANISDLRSGLQKTLARNNIQQVEGKHYMKLAKGGFWIYGKDNQEVEEDSQWAINPNSFAMGYIAWHEDHNQPLGEEMRSVMDEPLTEKDLPDVGCAWTQQVSMELVCVSGEDKGTQVIYKSNSKGGRDGFGKVLTLVLAQLEANPEKSVPVVYLDVDSYDHPKKSYGKIYTPVFKLARWAGMDEGMDTEVEEAAPEVEEAPAPRRRRRS
jgi:hypothetical protein